MDHALVQTDTEAADALLAPIAGPAAAGADLRLDASPQSPYFRLRDARASARQRERLADDDPANAVGGIEDWLTVETLATEAIATATKDVEIAAWLTESLTRRHGLPGLTQGARLIAGLIERYGADGLHPAPEPDDAGVRLAALEGLSGADRDGSLAQPLRKTVLFVRDDGEPLHLWELSRASERAALIAAGRAPRARGDAPSFEALEAMARGPGRAALAALGVTVAAALEAWRLLEDAAAACAAADGTEPPATSRVRQILEDIQRTAQRYAPEAPPAIGAAAGGEAAGPAPGAADARVGHEAAAAACVPDRLARERMFEEVLAIAASFRENEPNSPFGLTLEEAVRRARLPIPDLLRELLPDLAARAAVLSALGIRPPAD